MRVFVCVCVRESVSLTKHREKKDSNMPEGNIVNLPSEKENKSFAQPTETHVHILPSSSFPNQDEISQQLMNEIYDLLRKIQLQKKAFDNLLEQREEINKIISQKKAAVKKFDENRKNLIEYKGLLVRGLEIENELESILNQLPTSLEEEEAK